MLFSLLLPLTLHASWGEIGQAEQRRRLQELTPAPWSGKIRESKIKNLRGCELSTATIEVSDGKGATWEFSYQVVTPEKSGKVPLVMVIPTIERLTPLEPTIIYQLCSAGYGALLVDANDNSQPDELPAWGHEDVVLKRTIHTVRTILDWAQTDSRFLRTKIGLFGHSLGGITASVLAGVEPVRLKAIVVAVGGGNMPGILTDSVYPRVALLRWRRFLALKDISSKSYEKELQKHVRFDPLFFAQRVRTENLYFVMAAWDRSVPFEYQLQTYRAFGSPEYHLFSPGTHIDGLIRLATIDFDLVVKFLDQRLK